MAGLIDVELSRPDLTKLGRRWRELEARADCSFFQSWTWTGCLAAERYSNPVLLAVRGDLRDKVLGLFNRRPVLPELACLWLGESGDRTLDTIYIEHNGLLAEAGVPERLKADCLRAARVAPIDGVQPLFARRLVLSGVHDTGVLASAGSAGRLLRSRAAPFIDLAAVRVSRADYLNALSTNTRQQLRRSDRAYVARGPLALRRADSVAEAHQFLDALASLHQARWSNRGHPGAFAAPFFRRFHRALIERGMPRGEIDLLRVTAGERVVGYLYNLRYRGHALAYQSGFDYLGADKHQKPGLTCHHAAIRQYLADGIDRYDFLAGDDRYKRSLSTGTAMLHWLEIGAPWAPRRVLSRLRRNSFWLDRFGRH
jgi:CelD/BcsL family acetyltransferase involved in cellulose biosynthesis